MRAVFFAILVFTASMTYAGPCDHIDRRLTAERKVEIARAAAGQLNAKTVDVLEFFRSDSWTIAYVETPAADGAYLFFSGDPLESHYVTLWSGAARRDEEQTIFDWTKKNAPHIPDRLAQCFASRVTKEQDR